MRRLAPCLRSAARTAKAGRIAPTPSRLLLGGMDFELSPFLVADPRVGIRSECCPVRVVPQPRLKVGIPECRHVRTFSFGSWQCRCRRRWSVADAKRGRRAEMGEWGGGQGVGHGEFLSRTALPSMPWFGPELRADAPAARANEEAPQCGASSRRCNASLRALGRHSVAARNDLGDGCSMGATLGPQHRQMPGGGVGVFR